MKEKVQGEAFQGKGGEKSEADKGFWGGGQQQQQDSWLEKSTPRCSISEAQKNTKNSELTLGHLLKIKQRVGESLT